MTDVELIRIKIGGPATETLVNDEVLGAFLIEEGSVAGAAAAACEALAAHYAIDFDVSTDDQSLKRSQKAKAYEALAGTFRDLAERNEGIGTIATIKIDGYNLQEYDNESIAGAGNSQGGRVRAGYIDPDEHP